MCRAVETTGAGWYRVAKADTMTIPGPQFDRYISAKVSAVSGESEASILQVEASYGSLPP